VLGPLIAGTMLDHGGLRACAWVLLGLVVLQIGLMWRNWAAWGEEAMAGGGGSPGGGYRDGDGWPGEEPRPEEPEFYTPRVTPRASAEGAAGLLV
jgi:hypothetical protein